MNYDKIIPKKINGMYVLKHYFAAKKPQKEAMTGYLKQILSNQYLAWAILNHIGIECKQDYDIMPELVFPKLLDAIQRVRDRPIIFNTEKSKKVEDGDSSDEEHVPVKKCSKKSRKESNDDEEEEDFPVKRHYRSKKAESEESSVEEDIPIKKKCIPKKYSKKVEESSDDELSEEEEW